LEAEKWFKTFYDETQKNTKMKTWPRIETKTFSQGSKIEMQQRGVLSGNGREVNLKTYLLKRTKKRGVTGVLLRKKGERTCQHP